MIVVGWVVEWKGDGAGGVWVCGCVAWVWEVRMRGASPRSGAFWCERSGREERREEPGRLVHAWCDLLRIILTLALDLCGYMVFVVIYIFGQT